MRLVRSSAPPSSSDDNGVSVMRTACALGLAWTVLLAGVTAGAAQTAPERPLPPIRLPGIMYPDQPEAAPTSPERSSKSSALSTACSSCHAGFTAASLASWPNLNPRAGRGPRP